MFAKSQNLGLVLFFIPKWPKLKAAPEKYLLTAK